MGKKNRYMKGEKRGWVVNSEWGGDRSRGKKKLIT